MQEKPNIYGLFCVWMHVPGLHTSVPVTKPLLLSWDVFPSSCFSDLAIILPADCWQIDAMQVPWKRLGESGAAGTKLSIGRKIWEGQVRQAEDPKQMGLLIQIPQQNPLSAARHSIRTFLSVSGRPSDINIWQVTLPTAQIAKSHNRSRKNYCCASDQASQIPVVGTAQKLETAELCGINSPVFLQKVFEWQGNLPMRLQMGNKPEKHQHLEILAVLA